jgi:hypothetical protein
MRRNRKSLKLAVGASLLLAAIFFNPISIGKLFMTDGIVGLLSLRLALWVISLSLLAIFFIFIQNSDRAIEHFRLNYKNYFLLFFSIIASLIFAESLLQIRAKRLKYRSAYASAYEFHYTYRLNSHGFRDEEFTKEKPKGVLRVFMIGDSFVEGMVKEEYAIDRLLENKFKNAGRDCQVYNLGIPGTSTPSYLKVARQFKDYSPDLIIISLYSMTALNDGLLRADSQAFLDKLKQAVNNLQLVRFAEEALTRFLSYNIYPWLEKYEGHNKYKKLMLEGRINPWLFKDNEYIYGLGGYQKYHDSLAERFNKEARARENILAIRQLYSHLPVLLVIIPSKYQVNSRYFDILREMGLPCADYQVSGRKLQDTIISWAAENSLDCLDILPAMRKRAKEPFYYEIDIHFNPRGNYLAVNEIYNKLQEMGIVR